MGENKRNKSYIENLLDNTNSKGKLPLFPVKPDYEKRLPKKLNDDKLQNSKIKCKQMGMFFKPHDRKEKRVQNVAPESQELFPLFPETRS